MREHHILTRVNDPKSELPFPIVTGGFGLLFSYVLPGGLSGGQGFLIGIAVGFLILALVDLQQKKRGQEGMLDKIRCPHCGENIQFTSKSESKNHE